MKETLVASVLSLAALTHAQVGNVVKSDIVADNGVIHVIDSMVMVR